jgi:hypothetical protein
MICNLWPVASKCSQRKIMNTKSESLTNRSTLLNLISWLFGLVFFAIGLINAFWGNDPGFGVFILLLSCVYFPPLNVMLKDKIGLAIPGVVKILLAIFILWAALGVGELFRKIHLMMQDF